ncbi:MAG: ATP-binding protein [Rhodospirillaceae bacterium]
MTGSSKQAGGPIVGQRAVKHLVPVSPPAVRPPARNETLSHERADLESRVRREFDAGSETERYRLAMEGSQDAIWDWDIDADRLYVAPRLSQILDYQDDRLSRSGDAILDLLHPDDRIHHHRAMTAHLKGQTEFYSVDLRLRRSNGSFAWMYARGRGIRDEAGRVTRVVGALSDITERKMIEEARADAEMRVRRAQMRLADAINVSADGFALFDGLDRLVMFNDQLSGAFGAAAQKIDYGVSYGELIAALADMAIVSGWEGGNEEWLARQKVYHEKPEGNVLIETVDGRWFKLTERKTNEGGTVMVLGDVTAMKRAETDLQARYAELQNAKAVSDEQGAQLTTLAGRLAEAKEVADAASRTKSEFLANMSHELRTPLNAIMGFSEVIKNELFGPVGVPQYKQYAIDVYDSGAHLLAIINDILDLSKVEAGRFDLNETEIQVADQCRSVLHIVKGRADDGGITLVKGLPDDLPYLLADPRTLKQMLLNLLSNALKFTGRGGTVDLVVSLTENNGFRFDVRDTGVGIPKEHFATVLSPFGQVDTAHARDHQGTGLGLPLVKAFIEMHGGRLQLESEVGEGTTVSLFFPPERTRY